MNLCIITSTSYSWSVPRSSDASGPPRYKSCSRDRSSAPLWGSTPTTRPTSPASQSCVFRPYQCNRCNYISGGVHLKHGVDLGVFKTCLRIAFVLAGQIRVLVHADKWTPSQIEVFDHKLSESIIGVVHFVVEKEGQVEFFVDIVHKIIHFIGVDVAQHTFTIEKSRRWCVNFMLLQNFIEVLQIR